MIWTWLIRIFRILFISVAKASEIGSTTVIILLLFRTFYHPVQFFFLGKQEKQVLVTQSCLTLCDPMDCNPPGSSAHGILQGRTLEWVALPSSGGSSQLRDQTWVSCIAGGFFTVWTTREAQENRKEGGKSAVERDNLSYLSGLWSRVTTKQKPYVDSENTQLISLGQCLLSFDGPSNHLGIFLKCLLIPPVSGWEQRAGIATFIEAPYGAHTAGLRTAQEVVGSTDSPPSVCTAPAVPDLWAKAALLHHQQQDPSSSGVGSSFLFTILLFCLMSWNQSGIPGVVISVLLLWCNFQSVFWWECTMFISLFMSQKKISKLLI